MTKKPTAKLKRVATFQQLLELFKNISKN